MAVILLLAFRVDADPQKPVKSEWPLLAAGEGVATRLTQGDVRAAHEITELRRKLEETLVKTLSSADAPLDPKYEGAHHLIVRTLGQWRLTRAVPILAKSITFRVNPPEWTKVGRSALYPAAQALAAIGDRVVIQSMTDLIEKTDDRDVQHLSTWVIWRMCGRELGEVILGAEAKKADGKAQQRIGAAMALLAKGDDILQDIGP